MKKMILLMLLLVSVMGYSQAAEVISVNFAERANQHVTAGETAGLYDYASANFNNFIASSDSGALVDETGSFTGASISFASSNLWGDGGDGFATPDAKISRGYLDDGDGAVADDYGVDIQVTDVPFAEYTVVVYHSTGDNGVITNGYRDVTVNGVTDRCVTGNRWQNVRKWIPGTNCVVFKNVTGSTLDIKVLKRSGSTRGCVAGFQIILETKAIEPIPGNGDTGVIVDSGVQWTAPTSYVSSEFKVYMDPNESLVASADPSVLIATQTETTLPTSDMLYGETYFWRVDSTDPNGGGIPVVHVSKVWSFTQEEHPSALEPAGTYAPGIYIGNPSFEKQTNYWTATSDWFDNGGAYQGNPMPTPYGNMHGVLETSGTFWQAIGTWQPNIDYLISWGVNKRSGYGDGGTKASLWTIAPGSVPADQGTGDATTPAGIAATMIAETAPYTSGVDNLFVEVSEILNTGTSGTDGDALIIQFVNGLGTSRGYFDMVRVEIARDGRSAWGPSPLNSTADIDATVDLTLLWNQGVDPAANYQLEPTVTGYHIYLGIDKDIVGSADTSTAGIYQGFKPVGDEAIVIPAPFPDGMKLYWRVDEEINNGGEIVTGPLWEMTTALSDRLIAHWKFEDNLNDEVSALFGTAEGDWPGAMTLPVYEAGVDGQGIRFYRGDGDIVTIPGSEDYFNFYSDGLTVNMWYKNEGYSDDPALTGYMGLMSKTGGQSSDGWKIFETAYYSSQGSRVQFDNIMSSSRGGRLDDGQWHMVTITYDETTQIMTGYLDGEVFSRDTPDAAADPAEVLSTGTSAQLVIGALTAGGSWQFRGMMDEVKIYSYARNEYEVAGEYTADYSNFSTTKKICPFPDDPLLQYDFNGDCRVDIIDLAYLASNWTACNIVPTCIDKLKCNPVYLI